MRYFNTSGPIVAADHYHIPPLDRVDLPEILQLVAQQQYFVLHAPRQTGKTSVLLALQDLLNAESDHRCVYVNVKGAQTAQEDVEAAIGTVLNEMAQRAQEVLGDDSLAETWPAVLATAGPHSAFGDVLRHWAGAAPEPLVLLIDEIDAMVGDSFLGVLRQLRASYDLRFKGLFPHSVVLCGVRDVRDHGIRSKATGAVIAGGSGFNIKGASLRLDDFGREEMDALLRQHTDETGQAFAEDALDAVWTQTQGQPWLVNALAYETCFRGDLAADRGRPVTANDVMEAREALILRGDIRLDHLREDRVRSVIEPLLTGSDEGEYSGHDLKYVRDLGLIVVDFPRRMANPIYAEVATQELIENSR